MLDAFKLESTREMENTADNLAKHREISIAEAYIEIGRATKLAEIANKTTDREEFYNSINEIERILTELSKYEHKFNFSYPPSADLEKLRQGRNKQIEFLEKRIAEKERETINVSASVTDSNKKYNHDNYYKDDVKDSEQEPTKNSIKPKAKRLSKYDLERYAIECNAYVVREERKNHSD